MNDEQIIICAALCGVAAFLGYKFGQQEAMRAAQAAQGAPIASAAPMDATSWLMAGGWAR